MILRRPGPPARQAAPGVGHKRTRPVLLVRAAAGGGPSTSGSPPQVTGDAPATSDAQPSASPSSAPTSTATPPSPASTSGSPSPPDPGLSDAELAGMWESVKKDMKKELTPDEARVLDTIKVEDLTGDPGDLMRKVADEQLGPILSSMGISEDPLDFFVDLLRIATAAQLLSAGALFYGAEWLGHLDAGEAFRCVAGLGVGYLSRPFFRVEQLLWPLYDGVLRLVAPGAVYEVETSREESTTTLSRMGVALAVAALLPQALWGWDSANTAQFVVPLAAGWAFFDVAYLVALLVKLDGDKK
ncbi:hypothetical protein HYH03_017569 [Edaphochlamys debaryana]|uniref:Uncharacterized protein n=1 Tax=Edaphochlamys debaryana TaxID=47281 RepID=A0A835XI69_9CHLO|nr:hypothetical protein HYH03_017569 [Edaphochlamys debaryana]|eukprot:KAG2483562.1 hypothetical protein HYH03_017569 [Edaphochlamys debaryana]